MNASPRTIRRARVSRGIQMVEMAICMPLLLTLFAVTGEVGRLYFLDATLAKGTRVAARYLSTAPLNSSSNVTLYYANARNLAVYGKIAPSGSDQPIAPGLSASNVVIVASGGTSTMPDFITVQITGVTFTPLLNLRGLIHDPAFSLSVPLTPSTTMRYLITQPLT